MATALDQPAAQPPPTTATPGGGPIVIDTQHDDMVHDSQLDYYGCKLATASSGESPRSPVGRSVGVARPPTCTHARACVLKSQGRMRAHGAHLI